MLGQSFNQAVRQAHLLYNELPLVGDFDINMDVYEGQLMTFDELRALKNATHRSYAEDVEDEDQ